MASDWNVAVCDFGVSRMLDSLNMTRAVGTPLYTAPEVLEGTRYGLPADVYSYGICLWQLVHRVEPYVGINFMALVPKIVSENMRPPVDPAHPYAALMTACWSVDPDSRPTFREIILRLKKLRRPSPIGIAESRVLTRNSAGGLTRSSEVRRASQSLRRSMQEVDTFDSSGTGNGAGESDDDNDASDSSDTGDALELHAALLRMPLRKSRGAITRSIKPPPQ